MSVQELKRVNVRIDKAVLEKLKEIAKKKKWSYNLVVRTAIDEYIERQK